MSIYFIYILSLIIEVEVLWTLPRDTGAAIKVAGGIAIRTTCGTAVGIVNGISRAAGGIGEAFCRASCGASCGA